MSIWKTQVIPADINAHFKNTICERVGIEVIEIGDDYIKATMPVDERTQQHMGILHGGSSALFAETLGGIGGSLCCEPGSYVVGIEINANHLRAGKPPYVTGITRPLHIGNTTMVWEIKIYDVDDKLVCISRLTNAVIKSKE